MSAWHGIYADLLRQRFSGLVAYGVVLVGDRDAARDLAQRATESVFSQARAPRGVSQAERAVRREMVHLSFMPDAGAGSVVDPLPDRGAQSHVAIRGWLATLGTLERAAATLYSLDGLDEAGVRRALGRAVGGKNPPSLGLPLPDAHANEVRALYRDEASRYASPTGGANGSIGTSRSGRRKALTRGAAVTGGVAVIAAALGFGAAQAIDVATVAAPVPTASASPSPTTTALVEWDPATVLASITDLRMPECGEEWAPEPQSVGGITPTVQYVEGIVGDERPGKPLYQSFDYGDTEPTDLLYIPQLFAVTLDGVVVYTQDLGETPAEHWMLDYIGPSRNTTNGALYVDGANSCAAQAEWDELFGDSEWDDMTQEERDEFDKAVEAFFMRWRAIPSGEYQVYVVTPIILGEQAAVAAGIVRSTAQGLSQIYWGLGDTEFASDPRLAPYCQALDDGTGYYNNQCDPPADVLKQVLAQEVDPATVVDIPPGLGISAPATVTVTESD